MNDDTKATTESSPISARDERERILAASLAGAIRCAQALSAANVNATSEALTDLHRDVLFELSHGDAVDRDYVARALNQRGSIGALRRLNRLLNELRRLEYVRRTRVGYVITAAGAALFQKVPGGASWTSSASVFGPLRR